MRSLRFLAFALLAFVSTAHAQSQTRLLRSPTISDRNIAFAYANNIWVVDRAGGSARRLTSFQGATENPKFSPDGKWIAFTAEYGGNTDAYIVPVEGGQPKRLTWHPGADMVQGWTPDGKNVVFSSTRAAWAPSGAPRFFTVSTEGGPEVAMPMPRAYQGKISPDGKRIAYRMNNSWDEERRNYRGGQNRPIWVADLATLDVVSPPWTDSKDIDPVWVGDAVYFISDRDGVANVWSWDTKSKALKQQTHFSDFDVKALDAGGNSVVFEQAGYIHTLDPASSTQKIVNISAAGDFPWMMAQWKDVNNRMANLALSPTGKRAAVEARGEIFTVPAEKGDVRNITNSSNASDIWPTWSPDGKSIAYFSDRSGEYKMYISAQEGLTPPREIVLPEPSRPYTPAWSPDGKRIAFHDTHFRLWLVDVATGKASVADTDPYFKGERSLLPVWSPDSRYVAYPKRLPSYYRAIYAYDVTTGEKHQLTDGLADATAPAWDASGKYLWFLASTNYGLHSGLLDMSSYDRPETKGLYLAILSKTEASPLLPESDEEAARTGGGARDTTARPARPDSARAAGDTNRVVPPRSNVVHIDFDGMQQRIIAVQNVAQRDYTALRAGAPGMVYFLEPNPATGTSEPTPDLNGPPAAAGNTLHRYQLSSRRATVFASGVAQFVVSGDGHKLLYRTPGAAGQLFLVDADRAAPTAGTGRMNVALRAYVDPKQEFEQIFNEDWRNQRNNLYVRNMHGSDWPAMKKMYAQLLPYVNHRADLNYVMDMMGAEISIGHSYVRGGDLPEVPRATGGLLGADFTVENGRYRIAKIYDAESWNPELRAPLAMPGVTVRSGDYLLAVNGTELRGSDDLYRLLDGTANRQTVITVGARPAMDGARQITVIPIANEQGLRTRAWVEHNRRYVDSVSKGTVAYVYLPNTGQPGYTSFNRYYFAQQDRQGAVVDERYNGGGSAADYIVDLLGRDFDGYFNNPVGDRRPYTSPANGIWGPKVMIVNEMAGSGGDLMPYMFNKRKIGTLVGKRTWGGLVATTDTPPFVDGGSAIAPRFGFFGKDGTWEVENKGVMPDIDVENWPKDVLAGRDSQLERATQEAMRQLKEHPPKRDMQEPPPSEWGKRKQPIVP
ncbi:MAG: PDZ domain-containing protein [Gemmatimonadota bacterium]